MTTASLRRQVLNMSFASARRRLQDLIARGTRLAGRMRSLTGGEDQQVALTLWQNWYLACTVNLREIYPTDREADAIHRAQSIPGGWHERVQHVVDAMEDLRDTVTEYAEPLVQAKLVAWLKEQPGLMRFLNVTGYVVSALIGRYSDSILACISKLLGA